MIALWISIACFLAALILAIHYWLDKRRIKYDIEYSYEGMVTEIQITLTIKPALPIRQTEAIKLANGKGQAAQAHHVTLQSQTPYTTTRKIAYRS